jgi:PAS domain S-box-containing protein
MSRQDHSRRLVNGRTTAARRQRVAEVAKNLSATLGHDFLQSVVKSLASTFQADCVYIAELAGASPVRLSTLAVYGGEQGGSFELSLSGSPAGQVVLDGSYACSKDAAQIFAGDPWTGANRVEGYAGIRLCDSAGQAVGILAIASRQRFTDIELVKTVLETFAPRTAAELARKRADDIHRENEERYHAFVSRNPDAMWRIEFEARIPQDLPEDEQLDRIYRLGYVAECNSAAARLFGAECADEMVGWRFDRVLPREDTGRVAELRESIRSRFASSVVETADLDADGRQRYRQRSTFAAVEKGELLRVWGTTRDTTELRLAEMAVVASERRFRNVLEGIQLPAFMLDPQGTLTFCNDCFVRLANQSRVELQEQRWLEGIIPGEEADKWKAAFLSEPGGDATRHFEGEILQREGPSRVVLWNTICLRSDSDGRLELAAIGRDLSYQQSLEAQIRLSQKLDGVGRFAARIGHDFNDTLTVIRGHTDRLLHSAGDMQDPQIRASLFAIEKAAMQCSGLIDRLLTFGRKHHLRPERIDLNDVITAEEWFIRSQLGAGIELSINRASPLWLVYADPTQLQRILANLVAHARDAMPQGGKLVLETSNEEIGEGDLIYPGVPPGAYVRLSVAGAPAEMEAGLELSTVFALLKQSGGYACVQSDAQQGRTLHALLPAVARLTQ